MFFLIAKRPRDGELLVNVKNATGVADLRWVIDRQGRFFEMTSLGVLPKTFFERLGITRQKEHFRVGEPRSITIKELKSRVAGAKDQFQEAPYAAQTRKLLRDFHDERTVDADVMRVLLGED
ncbi:MAG: hypothetical protein V2I43_19320 [Parvularcula sp.]|nr:hypothetical protein [Parvularcula sp.]